ncbi:MAG TPA: hypothetical protein VND19_01025 [Acetobacteraceae bacterium]|nr:hypothetical protein [Acetobacteraceae bacterium]
MSLALDGRPPAIVLADTDLKLAIAGAASAIFFNHSQRRLAVLCPQVGV